VRHPEPIKGYRLVKRKYAETAFSGYGALKFGGRWNSQGQACVYLAECESLAMLEVLVHVNQVELLDEFALYQIDLDPESIMLGTALPKNWHDSPAPRSSALYGDQWLRSAVSLGLKLPSTIVPRQWNYLINVAHVDFEKAIKTVTELPFCFDSRLK
jgi:RES domain-containing protein